MSQRAEPLYTTPQITFFFPIKTHGKMSRGSHQKACWCFCSYLHGHKHWPLFEQSHCGGNENVLLSASLFSLQGDSVQASIGQNYNPNSLLWPFSCLVNWDCVFEGEIWLNNMPLGGKSRDRQSNSWSLTQPRTREMNYSSIQPIVWNSSGDESS